MSTALLGPDTVSWRVNHEPAIFTGGGRALLLQVGHPLVAAGVGQHSNYDKDPWSRLFRTLDTAVKIAFGDAETSERAATRLRRRHDTVKGVSDDGVPYDAQDPRLLIWVWATLLETSVVIYERCFAPLGEEKRERYYQEQKLFAYACGVPEGECPETWADFCAYWDRMLDEELRVTKVARDVKDSIVRPPVPWPLHVALAPNTLLTAGLLPPALRAEYGFEWGPRQERLLNAAFAAMRVGTRVVPRRLRELPVRYTAEGRFDRNGRGRKAGTVSPSAHAG